MHVRSRTYVRKLTAVSVRMDLHMVCMFRNVVVVHCMSKPYIRHVKDY